MWGTGYKGGCDRTMELLHVYVELVANGGPGQRPLLTRVEAHLAACGPCAEDFHGLLAEVDGE